MRRPKKPFVVVEAKRCNALNRNCNTPIADNNGEKCKYRFSKGETKCPECGSERRRCRNWSIKDSTRCKYHGGYAKKHRKYDDYGVPVNFFDAEDIKEIHEHIDSGKQHEQLIYQMAFQTFKRLVSTANELDKPDLFVFQMCCEHFERVSKSMAIVKKSGEPTAPTVQIVQFDQVGAAMYEKRLAAFAGKMVGNVLSIVFDVIRSEGGGDEIVGKVRNRLPEPIKKLIDERKETEQKQNNESVDVK